MCTWLNFTYKHLATKRAPAFTSACNFLCLSDQKSSCHLAAQRLSQCKRNWRMDRRFDIQTDCRFSGPYNYPALYTEMFLNAFRKRLLMCPLKSSSEGGGQWRRSLSVPPQRRRVHVNLSVNGTDVVVVPGDKNSDDDDNDSDYEDEDRGSDRYTNEHHIVNRCRRSRVWTGRNVHRSVQHLYTVTVSMFWDNLEQ